MLDADARWYVAVKLRILQILCNAFCFSKTHREIGATSKQVPAASDTGILLTIEMFLEPACVSTSIARR